MSNTTKNFGIPKPPESWADLHPGKGLPECVNEALDFIDTVIQFHQRKVTLTAAQIKTLKATPMEMVPAPGAGKVLALLRVVGQYKAGTTPYTVLGGNFAFIHGLVADGNRPLADNFFATDFIDQANDVVQMSSGPLDYLGYPSQAGSKTFDNQPIYVANDGSAEWTVGNGTVVFTVCYAIVDIS